MKKNILGFYSFIVCVCSVLALGGCVSVLSSPNPRFYTLSALSEKQLSEEFDIPSGTIIGIGPVKIPEYLNRPQIVTVNKDKTLSFAEFERWAEPLDFAMARLINEDLTLIFPSATLVIFPWDVVITVKYQVIADVIRLENELDKDLFLVAQWSIIDLEKKQAVFTKRSQFRQPIAPHNYYGLTEALSNACAALSSEVAQGLVSLLKERRSGVIREMR